MAVEYEKKPTFTKKGTPRMIIQNKYISFTHNAPNWDIHPDGKCFLMLKEYDAESETDTNVTSRKINVVLNWLEDLKKNVPVD